MEWQKNASLWHATKKWYNYTQNNIPSEIQFIFINKQFEFAVGMAQTVAPHKLKAVQRQLAVHLQSSDHWKEAEEAFVKVF
jgi:hypothetical protein